MAYFECISGGAGGGATITVTYDSSFYNKTITCSNGSKTYTKTTTSSGSTEFSVSDEGTWTITCNGVSRTVDVVLNYVTEMVITVSVTLYSAAQDTVTYTDANGSQTVVTDATGVAQNVSITVIPNSTITMTSSVAKNPDNLSADYSKTFTITENTTELYLMPDGVVLYWWGYKSDNLQSLSTANGWTTNLSSFKAFINPTYNTNDIFANTTGYTGNYCCGIGNATEFSSSEYTNNDVILIGKGISLSSGFALRALGVTTKTVNGSAGVNITTTAISKVTTSANKYVYAQAQGDARSGNIYALYIG